MMSLNSSRGQPIVIQELEQVLPVVAEHFESVWAADHLYGFARHPMYAGFALGIWSSPRMTEGHFLFAAAMLGERWG